MKKLLMIGLAMVGLGVAQSRADGLFHLDLGHHGHGHFGIGISPAPLYGYAPPVYRQAPAYWPGYGYGYDSYGYDGYGYDYQAPSVYIAPPTLSFGFGGYGGHGDGHYYGGHGYYGGHYSGGYSSGHYQGHHSSGRGSHHGHR